MRPTRLRCEHLVEPLGIDSGAPRLSWICSADPTTSRGKRQTAYRLQAGPSREAIEQGHGDAWDSGKVASDASVLVPYTGPPLRSLHRYYWRVTVWDERDEASESSDLASWVTGIFRAEDWPARWLICTAAGRDGGAGAGLCPWFRCEFDLEEVPPEAFAAICSLGFHELYINGRKIGDQVLTPSVSDLQNRALYNTYDIASHLQRGRNVAGIWIAPGWTTFRDANPPVDFGLSSKPAVLGRFDFGGAAPPLVTDETWRCSPSHLKHAGRWQNSDFGGDEVDMQHDQPGWNTTSFNDRAWMPAVEIPDPGLTLSADVIEPNRCVQTIPATKVREAGDGKFVFEMERLYTGWIQVRLKGTPGQRVTISASSLPECESEYNQINYYTVGESGAGTFCNRFSYHECRFVTIEGLNECPKLEDVCGYQVINDRERVGEFSCSNELLTKIHEITASTYANLSTGGMTVDCPHRERLGYGGDAHVSLDIAIDTFASAAFFTKWACDWCDIQDPDGRINHTAPQRGGGGGPAWSGIVITMPWEIYLHYGDRRILEDSFPAMMRWLEYLRNNLSKDGLLTAPSQGKWRYLDGNEWLFLGDWVAPGRWITSDNPETTIFNSCYYVYVLKIAAQIAAILGKSEARRLEDEAERLTKAINHHLLDKVEATYVNRKQTQCVMPLIAGVVPSDFQDRVLKNLIQQIEVEGNGHLDTGMHGTYFMTKLLTELDRDDLIFNYATQTTYPSYGHLISTGHTTWPENWDGAESRMHGCLLGIGGWFMRGLAGIQCDEASPGYKHTVIRPAFVGDLTWVQGSFLSDYGLIVSNWTRTGNHYAIEVTLPPNTTATVILPGTSAELRQESNRPLTDMDGTTAVRVLKDRVHVDVGSGTYSFSGSLAG